MARVEGHTVQLGDVVSFKSDIEQSGRIIKIDGDILTLKATSERGFQGDYIGGEQITTEYTWDCWLD